MTDIDRGPIGALDEDRLPWLEAVEDEADDRGVGAGKLIAAVIAALVALGLVIGGIFWLRERSAGDEAPAGDGTLIAAPSGDYKVPPAEPGGMAVEGEGDATYAASEGLGVNSSIDISKSPEAPVTAGARSAEPVVKTAKLPPSNVASAGPASTRTALPAQHPETNKRAEAPKPEAPKAEAEPAAPLGGPAVQLGAFGSEAKAQAAWQALAGRFPALKPLSHTVTSATVNGKTLYRLRAQAGSSGRAGAVCKTLQSAKEPCNIVG